jgi:membrane fusion protein, multidrug efflux system
MTLRRTTIAFISALMVIPWAYCAKKNAGPVRAFPVPVLVATARSMDVPLSLREIGSVEAINTVAVTARIGGQLLRVGFKEGRNAAKGDLLFLVDPAPYEAALAQARAAFERDSAAMVNTESQSSRYKELVDKEYVTKQEYETVSSAAAEARSTLDADRALIRTATLNLGYCTIRAPIAGRLGNLMVTEGNLVTANAPTPLVTINQISPIYVRFSVPEAKLADVRRRAGQETLAVAVSLPDNPVKIDEGKLTFIDNAVDPATGTILLKATFPNANGVLWPGQFVQVDLVLGTLSGATVVPSSAVQVSQQGDFVYVVMPGDTVQVRSVVTGTASGDMIVIQKGIAPGERIVIDGTMLLRQGSKIAVKTGLAPAAPAEARKK